MRQNHRPAELATFEDWHEEHAGYVLRLTRLFGVAESERTDVAQEAWIDVHRSIVLYDPSKGSPRAWLGAITYNACRDWKRGRRRHPEFSTLSDQEPPDARLDPADAERSRRLAALLAFVERAIRNEDRRAAWALHEFEGLTVKEVAEATGVGFWTAQARIKKAREELRDAVERLTKEEREQMRAVVPPLGGVDGIVRALREAQPPVKDEEIARVWERVVERIEAEGGSIHEPIGMPAASPGSAAPPGYTFTGPGLTSAFAGVFLLGAVTGAGALYAFLLRDHRASMTTIDAEIPPAPTATAEPTPEPEPAPTASAAPSATSSPARVPGESEAWILDRARKAEPADAVRLTDLHAQRFPRSKRAEEREEIAIRALVQLGQRPKAEERAAKLVRWAPWMRQTMEGILGRSLF